MSGSTTINEDKRSADVFLYERPEEYNCKVQ